MKACEISYFADRVVLLLLALVDCSISSIDYFRNIQEILIRIIVVPDINGVYVMIVVAFKFQVPKFP